MPIKGWVTPVEESGIVENFITRQNTSSDLQSGGWHFTVSPVGMPLTRFQLCFSKMRFIWV
jgi:hypothetical protein